MNKFLKIFFVAVLSIFVFSCDEDEDAPVFNEIKLRNYQTQYTADLNKIEFFLKHYKISVINNPGASNDQDISFEVIPGFADNNPNSIMMQSNLKHRIVSVNYLDSVQKEYTVNYKVYFLELRKGTGERPCNVDNVFASYYGKTIDETGNLNGENFDFSTSTQVKLSLTNVIAGWSEIFPQFNSATITKADDGSNVFSDFGAGVMFIPSGLAYYNATPSPKIPAYTPLVFNFKLYNIERADQDNDGISSYLEDFKGANNSPADGYVYKGLQVVENGVLVRKYISDDDSDADGLPDFADSDDDGDGVSTKLERSISGNLNGPFYPYNNILDDPFTSVDETQIGIPDCSGNGVNPARRRRYLDANCNR